MKPKKIPKWLIEKMEGIDHFRLLFTDVLGTLKEIKIPRIEIFEVLEGGQGFDGSSIAGFARLEESDLMAFPRFKSFRVLPPKISGNGKTVGIFFCDIKTPNGKPFVGCPRQLLKKIRNKARRMGYTFNVGPELEFFLFKDKISLKPLDGRGYFDATTEGPGNKIVEEMVDAIQSIGIHIECSHHEVAPSQYEINAKYNEVLTVADQVMLCKWIIRQAAEINGVYATFSAKPHKGSNGSGMHTHMSLFKGEKNSFHDKRNKYNLSLTARQFCAGILNYVGDFTAVTNQCVNSYKRLVPGFEAPVYISWGQKNRSSLIRVPHYRLGKENATRIELRSPDPCCNPYLAFAVMLSAGLDGINRKLKLCNPIEDNIFYMSTDERRKLKINNLPSSLQEAVKNAARSAFVRKTLGAHIQETFLSNLLIECEDYNTHVSEFELDKTVREM
ncbi:MAG: glutamine synthetase family protein [Candidatus Kerfeldbacteria bacterium]